MTTPAHHDAVPAAAAAAARALAAASRDGRVLKAHGTGNDFVVVVDLADDVVLTAGLVAALCDRHHGVGGDGVIRIGGVPPPDVAADIVAAVADAPVFMDYRNGDGSIVEMCGNGVRVVAKVVHDLGLLTDGRQGGPAAGGDGDAAHAAHEDRLLIGTRAGMRPVTMHMAPHRGDDTGTGAGDGGTPRVARVTVDMGPPVQDAAAVGLTSSGVVGDVVAFRLPDVAEVPADTTFAGMSMGNPHAVTVVADVDDVDLARWGPVVETHPGFSDGVNVNVVEVVDRATVRLRVWERGVGETQACGTGACATVAAMAVAGRVDGDEPVTVRVRGGELVVEHDDRGHLLMTGPAEVVATVFLDPEWLAARA